MTDSSTHITGTKWNGMRRAPFTRKPLPIASKPMFAVRVPLKAVSDKRKAENKERRRVLAGLKARYPMCQRCNQRPSVDGHELKRRSAGGSITDETNIRMVCRPCHDWIGMNPVDAINEGFAVSRFAS